MAPVFNKALKAGHVGFVTDTYTEPHFQRKIILNLKYTMYYFIHCNPVLSKIYAFMKMKVELYQIIIPF